MGPVARIQDNFARFLDSDIWYSFRTSPVTVVATVLAIVMIVAAVIAPLITPQDPFDPASLDLLDAFTAPVWTEDGQWRFPLGTDDQGRDLYSAILYGSRISIGVGFASVILSIIIGVTLGLIAGYVGGTTDAVIMRIADVQISFPALLVALLLNGVLRSVLPGSSHETLALVVIIFSIGMSIWPQFARTVRGSTMVEKSKEYVQAARVIGLSSRAIMFRHVLPNVMGPVLVIGTINLAIAVLLEATLSFLGVGVPPTEPSLGTLIRIGQDFLFSGEWWIVIFPGVFLALLVLSVNLLGDWLRDALNPKLR
ncbi:MULTISPECIES: ABC transporter permease [unclassified Minwuia]|jgi:peptide/nickel transport system permease protein|uniref:ABC transporter permease n=1 Tax=unclassified Minwuia TaxID=2618799 RepID=UPI00247A6542|nr:MULTISPECIES: ABC transporter permease [unclassified Minwuia]